MNRKYLVTHRSNGRSFTNAVILSDKQARSASNYAALATELIESFPLLSGDDIEYTFVGESNWCKGCIVAKALVRHNPEGSMERWHQCEALPDIKLA